MDALERYWKLGGMNIRPFTTGWTPRSTYPPMFQHGLPRYSPLTIDIDHILAAHGNPIPIFFSSIYQNNHQPFIHRRLTIYEPFINDLIWLVVSIPDDDSPNRWKVIKVMFQSPPTSNYYPWGNHLQKDVEKKLIFGPRLGDSATADLSWGGWEQQKCQRKWWFHRE